MRIPLYAIALLGIWTAVLQAETFRLPADNPIATFRLPNKWNPQAFDNGVEASSKDGGLYIAIGYVDSKSVGKFLDNALEYLKRNGVEVDNDTVAQQDMELNGMSVVDVQWKGTDAQGKCEITLDLVEITENDGLMILYWAPPGGDAQYARELKAIYSSIQPVKEQSRSAE